MMTSTLGKLFAFSGILALLFILAFRHTNKAPKGMVWIPAGTFVMGNDDGTPEMKDIRVSQVNDEKPAHKVTLSGFWMDEHEVTNAQFKEFVEATGYVTVAEKKPEREDFEGQIEDISTIPEENLVPGSICFNPEFEPGDIDKDNPLWPYAVWKYEKNANWRQPEGPGSSIEDRMDHPVVHISWDDAQEYCKWAGKRLPTEAEWEYASRGRLSQQEYPWGEEQIPEGKWQANIWQGDFPFENNLEDGFKTTSPVKSFSPNGYGLYDMAGNVWEWCADYYRPDYYGVSPRRNPQGPSSSFDPQEPNIPKRVQRGGSFMCSDTYCWGYRNSSRMKGEPSSGAYHTGFRCVRSPGDDHR